MRMGKGGVGKGRVEVKGRGRGIEVGGWITTLTPK